jgi:glutamate-ammonia-ligase adenylyltransferase
MDLETLQRIGLSDPAQALQRIESLAGNGISDSDLTGLFPLLREGLRESPDPDRSLNSFVRWFAAVGNPVSHLQSLLRHPVSLHLFCLVTGCSQYFADLLVRNPEYFEILANPGVRGGVKSVAQLSRELASLTNACQRLELKRDALRRWKAREMLRIGVRDLLGLSDMAQTAHEFSNLADACVQQALAIARFALPLRSEQTSVQPGESADSPTPAPDAPAFAVIGMGKLGGQELNYSSDIDLIFVSGDHLPERVITAEDRKLDMETYLRRIAQTLINTLSDDTTQGHVFRVDMRLRPEGRFGPLVRSLASCRAYYESWAEPWEFQALLKARCVAGNEALGAAFLEMVTPYIYRPRPSAAFLEEVRSNKRRIEQKCAFEGETYTNVKTGYGGIRDVEFTVQRLQLAHGGSDDSMRTGNTLTAIDRLQQAHWLALDEAREFAADYVFLRNLEHRLQLLHGFQTQTLPPPEDTPERGRLARRMGYAEAASFEADLVRRRDRVHAVLERRFYEVAALPATAAVTEASPWTDLPELLDSLELPQVRETLQTRLLANGFTDIPGAFTALSLPMRGNEFGEMPPDTPVEFKAIAPRLLALAAASASPDAALAGVEAIALAVPNRAQLYASFDDSPEALERLISLSAGSPPLVRLLARHLEWLEATLSPDTAPDAPPALTAAEARARIGAGLAQRLQGAKTYEAKLETLARYYQREMLRIGTEELCGIGENLQANIALTHLAEVTLETLLDVCAAPLIAAHADPLFAQRALDRVAIVGLGKLGGAELSYGSDWDLLFTYEEPQQEADPTAAQPSGAFPLVNSLVERVIAAGATLISRNAHVEIDLRLRPWGRKGALILAPAAFAEYYRLHAEMWERQAAVKARVVAGNAAVGANLIAIMQAESFGKGLSADNDAAVQTMKRRIETERLKSDERTRDIKLGYGGLTDIEWLAQRLQLRGAAFPSLRVPGTLPALAAMAQEQILPTEAVEALTRAYRRLTRLRNLMWLQAGSSQDVLPTEASRRRVLARLLGMTDEAAFDTAIRESMAQGRRLFETYFYGAG